MAANIQIVRLTGAGPTVTDITGINTRANAEDAHSVAGTTNPIQIPAAGTNYSYWVSTQLNAVSSPTGTINNLRWYTDGANSLGTGVAMKVAQATAYAQATGTPGTTGTQLLVANYATLTPSPGDDAFGKTSASPLAVTGTISNPTTGRFGNIVVYQIEVGTTAAPGATGSETITWKYDET